MNLTRFLAAVAQGWQAWRRFWFMPTDPLALHLTRLLFGIVLIAWLLPLGGDLEGLFGLSGWYDRQALVEADKTVRITPRPVTWSILYPCGDNVAALGMVYAGSLLAFGLFAAGVLPRLTGVLSWVAVQSFTANPAVIVEADDFLQFMSFYLMLGYWLAGWGHGGWRAAVLGPVRAWPLAPCPPAPSLGANLALRLLQVHFALALVTMGLHKLQYPDWWSGVAYWFALYPAMDATRDQVLTYAPQQIAFLTVLSFSAYATLAWQIGFPTFAWSFGGRLLLLAGAVLAWAGCALLYQIPSLGPVLFVGCLSFVAAEEWRGWGR